jgi:hypothetical protein
MDGKGDQSVDLKSEYSLQWGGISSTTDLPSRQFRQNSWTDVPMELTIPMPVTATRRFMY